MLHATRSAFVTCKKRSVVDAAQPSADSPGRAKSIFESRQTVKNSIELLLPTMPLASEKILRYSTLKKSHERRRQKCRTL